MLMGSTPLKVGAISKPSMSNNHLSGSTIVSTNTIGFCASCGKATQHLDTFTREFMCDDTCINNLWRRETTITKETQCTKS